MNLVAADRIAKAVLYEGYMLYPYRPSALKNQQRFNFGVLYPQIFSEEQNGTDPWSLRSECLIRGSVLSRIGVRVRFLQLVDRSVDEIVDGAFRPVRSLRVEGDTFHAWQEALERELISPPTDVDLLNRHPILHPFQFSPQLSEELVRDSQRQPAGRIVRSQQALTGSLSVAAHPIAEDVFKITVQVQNFTSTSQRCSRDYALLHSLVSAHVVLGVEDGDFVSLLDPPAELRTAVDGCHNQGVFPVLVGEAGQRDTMLASPIILYDYPQIAPESAGDLFDGTEIDEILSLRIMTMTDEEKREMRESDERARQMLERTETMPAEQFMKMHGVLRGLRPVNEENP